MKNANIHLMRIPKEEERVMGRIFEKIRAENFPNLILKTPQIYTFKKLNNPKNDKYEDNDFSYSFQLGKLI